MIFINEWKGKHYFKVDYYHKESWALRVASKSYASNEILFLSTIF